MHCDNQTSSNLKLSKMNKDILQMRLNFLEELRRQYIAGTPSSKQNSEAFRKRLSQLDMQISALLTMINE